ncbi:MAG: Hsp70 family protein, partial [Chloroflexi bacterium]|nr:Hsp70 family protein [Chloroflexota bacterium]
TGKEQRITITASSGLAKDEVERLVKEAEAHAEEDARKREQIEARNIADTSAYQAEKTLQEFGEQIDADLKSEVEARIADVRSVLAQEDADAPSLQAATQALSAAVQKIGEAVYARQQAEAASASGPDDAPPSDEGPGDAGDDDTIEGEYREV